MISSPRFILCPTTVIKWQKLIVAISNSTIEFLSKSQEAKYESKQTVCVHYKIILSVKCLKEKRIMTYEPQKTKYHKNRVWEINL